MLRLLQMGPSKVLTTFLYPNSELLAALTLGSSPPPRTPPTRIPHCGIWPPSVNAALSPHPRLQTSYPPSAHSISSPFALPPRSLAPCYPSAPPAFSPPDSLRVLQCNAGGLRARSTELLHFLSSRPVDLFCIQESNLNSSSSFRIPGFSALRSDRTHSRSGILSSDTTHASGGVVIFVWQGL